MTKKERTEEPQAVDTGGGAYVGGEVRVEGGDFVGRDQVKTVSHGVSGEQLAALFAQVYQAIKARPQDPDVDKEELADTAQKIEQEAAKGEAANPNKVERWLGNLAQMAPDILEVTVACLTHPLAGVGTVIRKIAAKAKAEAGSG